MKTGFKTSSNVLKKKKKVGGSCWGWRRETEGGEDGNRPCDAGDVVLQLSLLRPQFHFSKTARGSSWQPAAPRPFPCQKRGPHGVRPKGLF